MSARRTHSRDLAVLGGVTLLAALGGCVTRQSAPSGLAPALNARPSPLLGHRFAVVPAKSLLVVLVYRAGALAAAGHNHVISCRCVSGTVYVPRDPMRAGFDLRIDVRQFTVDDPTLRAAEHSAEFPPDVSPAARQGTRHNMLGAALLNAAKFPRITLRSAGLRASSGASPRDIVAQVLVQLAGQRRLIDVPVRYTVQDHEVTVTGRFPLRQTDLGLTPFSALGGALKVRDGMDIRLHLVADAASP